MSFGETTLTRAARARCARRTTTALAGIVLGIGLLAGTPVPATAVADPGTGVRIDMQTSSRISQATFQKRLMSQINKRRAARDLRRVRRIDGCLDRYAQDWATFLATTGQFVHRDQNVITAACDMTWAGEALARGTGLTPAGTVRAWMRSRTHRAVILKKRANRAGIGIDRGLDGKTTVVLNFGDVS